MKTELEIQNILINKTKELNSICRICLLESKDTSISLFDIRNSTLLVEIVMRCSRVTIQRLDDFPQVICEICCGELQIADRFRARCESSDSLMRKLVFQGSQAQEEIALSNATSDNVKVESSATDAWIKLEDDRPIDSESDQSTNKGPTLELPIEEKIVKKVKKKFVSKKNKLNKKSSKKTLKTSKLNENFVSKHEADSNSLDNFNESSSFLLENNSKVKSKKFSCNQCNKLLSTKYSLEKHLASIHRDLTSEKTVKMYKCTECPYSTPRSYTLSYHMSIHTGVKPYKCDQCERCFAQPSSLYVHKKSHSDKMYYTCAECGKQFKHKFIYENHKNVHNNIKKFSCKICNKGLRSQTTLEDHMNRHNNIKNFSCEICGSTFVTRVELISHGKKHSDEKRFQCNICSYRCNVKKSLETHMLRHTGQRLFKCDLCELSCYTRVELKLHTRKHTKEKNYSCPVCQIKFSRSTGVNKHMLYSHGIQYKINDTTDRRVIK